MHLPSLRRKLPTSSVLWFCLAGGLALLAFTIVRGQVARAEGAQRAIGPTVAVVVAARDLAAGSVLTAGDLRLDDIPAVFLPPRAVTSLDAAVGFVSLGPVSEGEALAATRLGTSAYATSVTPGNVAITVGFATVPAGFSTADRVDAYATYAGARPYTTLVGEDLHVLAIGQTSTSVSGPTSTDVTLDVDPETARQLLQAAAAGALGLAVRPAATPSPSPSASANPGWSPPPG
jgi:Flp pilus assembly protein CpaB